MKYRYFIEISEEQYEKKAKRSDYLQDCINWETYADLLLYKRSKEYTEMMIRENESKHKKR